MRIPALADVNQMPPLPIQQPLLPGTPQGTRSSDSTCLIVVLVSIGVGFVVILAVAILVAVVLPTFLRGQQESLRLKCQVNLKQFGLAYKMWANDHEEVLPPLSPVPGEFFPKPGTLFPEYLSDPMVLLCPNDLDHEGTTGSTTTVATTDDSYFYLGYMMTNETEARAFIEAYKVRAAEGGGFEEDLKVEPGKGTGGSDRIVRLHSDPLAALTGVGDAVVPDASEVPIMFDRSPTHHIPGGINILYLDGHVEFMKLPGLFPAQQWFLDALAELER